MFSLQERLAAQAASHAEETAELRKQQAELRDIIDSSLHSRRAVTLKLDTTMHALNMSKGEAQQFLQVGGVRDGGACKLGQGLQPEHRRAGRSSSCRWEGQGWGGLQVGAGTAARASKGGAQQFLQVGGVGMGVPANWGRGCSQSIEGRGAAVPAGGRGGGQGCLHIGAGTAARASKGGAQQFLQVGGVGMGVPANWGRGCSQSIEGRGAAVPAGGRGRDGGACKLGQGLQLEHQRAGRSSSCR